MAGLQTLRRQAAMCTNRRGHRMSWAAPWHGESGSTQQAACKACGAWAQTRTSPQANSTKIGGPALAMNCPIDPKWL